MNTAVLRGCYDCLMVMKYNRIQCSVFMTQVHQVSSSGGQVGNNKRNVQNETQETKNELIQTKYALIKSLTSAGFRGVRKDA